MQREDISQLSASLAKFDNLRRVAQQLAWKLAETGQTISLAEADQALASMQPRIELAERGSLIQLLLKMGIMISDGRSLRFWHQTFQEYFFAATVIQRWRGAQSQLPRPPRWVSALLENPHQQSSLLCTICHLHDKELSYIIRVGLKTNPNLALIWIDDLQSELWAQDIVEQLLKLISRQALKGVKFSRVYANGILDFLWSSFKIVSLIFITTYVSCHIVPDSMEVSSLTDLLRKLLGDFLMTAVPLGFMYWRNSAIRSTKDRLLMLLTAMIGLHDNRLKATVADLCRLIENSRMARTEIKALASAVVKCNEENNPFLLICQDDRLYINIQALAYVQDPRLLSFLEAIIRGDNVYSIAAVRAMTVRATRYPEEKKRICATMEQTWGDKSKDWRIHTAARKLLVSSGYSVNGALLVVLHAIGWISWVSLLIAVSLEVNGIALKLKFNWLPSILSAIVMRGINKKNAKNIIGYFGSDGYSARFWNWMSYIFLPAIILRALAEKRIQRNATGLPSEAYPKSELPR